MCPGLGGCVEYVDLHPEAMKEACWLVDYVRIFTRATCTFDPR